MVLCDDPGEDAKRSFFTQAARKLRDKHIHSGVMDCKAPLPTGENARKRFGLKRSVGDPVIILAANTKKPHQVWRRRSCDGNVFGLLVGILRLCVSVACGAGTRSYIALNSRQYSWRASL